MKLWQIIILVGLVLGGCWGIYHAVTGYGAQRDRDGYDRRVAEESQAYKAAEDKGRQDQEKADADAIAQLKQQAADANQAVSDREGDIDDANTTINQLKARLEDAAQDPDGRRWLAEPIPAAILCRLQQPPTCPGPALGNPGH